MADTPRAATDGPHCTGARAHPGACPTLTFPQHPHRRATTRYSITRGGGGGWASNTCRRATPTTGASARSAPHPQHPSGSTGTRSSGLSTCRRVTPGSPGCLPGLRPERPRNPEGFGVGLSYGLSEDGGREEFDESAPTRRRNSSFSTTNRPTNSSNSPIRPACTPTNTRRSSYESGS